MARSIVVFILFVIWTLLFFQDCRGFEINQCVYNKQFQQHKKITKVRKYVYEYCIYNNLECIGKYIIRKTWFDKNHVKTECPSANLIDDSNLELVLLFNLNDFERDEFTCKCGCGKNEINPELIQRLQKLRNFIKAPIYIVSGFRCKEHNDDVGGVKNSQHLLGNAADIKIKKNNKWLTGNEIYEIIEESGLFKTGGIGCYSNFVHLDVRKTHARWRG